MRVSRRLSALLQEVVTQSVEGVLHRSTYAELNTRSQQCALALQQLGVK